MGYVTGRSCIVSVTAQRIGIVVLNQHSPPGIGVSVGGHGCSRGRFT
jgi:hypothetical protein